MASGRTSCSFVYGIPLSPSMFTLLGMSIIVSGRRFVYKYRSICSKVVSLEVH